MNYESFDWSLLDWGKDGSWGYKTDLFLHEHKKCDKLIVSKAFVDAYNKNDFSIVEPYLSNPINYSCQFEEGLIDKDTFLKKLSDSINSLHECGKIKATIKPTLIKNKYIGADVLIRKSLPFGKSIESTLSIHTFLNCVYKIDISSHEK